MPKGITDVGRLLNDIMLWLMVRPYRCKNKAARHYVGKSWYLLYVLCEFEK
nr:MAG TPA: hypothetical protein [Caudoviricetes sp.]